jgi:acyl carrier protein
MANKIIEIMDMKDKFIDGFKEALELEGKDVNMSDSFRDYDEWNSLGRLSLIAMLDENFDVTIEDEVFKNLITVDDLYQEVFKRAQAAN